MKKRVRKGVVCYDGTQMLVTYYPDEILRAGTQEVLCLAHCIEFCEEILNIFKDTEKDGALTFDDVCSSVMNHTDDTVMYDSYEHQLKLTKSGTWKDPHNRNLYPICYAKYRNFEIYVYLHKFTALKDITNGNRCFFKFS